MYRIKQLSVFIENKKGELTAVTTLFSKNNISIKSINLSESSDFGLLRMIVDDEVKAKEVIDEAGFSLRVTDVIAVEIDDHLGSFNKVVSLLSQNDINIEYTYTVSNAQNGAFIFKVAAQDFEKASQVLSQANVKILKNI